MAQQLLRSIRRGDVSPGQCLPSERSIAERMGVSRGVVREALSALQISGIVQIRTGEGAYVCSDPFTEHQRHEVLSLLEGNESPLELWEARREIETVVICLAARTATEQDHTAIEGTLNRMRTATETFDVEAYLAANGDFHRLLTEPAENSILKRIASDLIDRTSHLTVKIPVDRYVRADIERSLAKHVEIFTAYRERQREQLVARIHRHFDELEVHFLQD